MTLAPVRAPEGVAAAPPPPGRGLRRPTPVAFLVPAALLLLAFALWPLVVLVRMSLSDVGPTNIVGTWPSVGLANYADLLGEPELWAAVVRTATVCAVLLLSNLVLGLLVASVLREEGRLNAVVLGVMVFVWALPPIVSGSVWKFLLDDAGAVNALLGLLGAEPVNWLSEPDLAMWSVSAVVAWAALPFSALVLRGGLLAIPQDVLEAAQLDGAGFWRIQLRIVLPLLRPTMAILAILTVVYAFKSFDFVFVLTRGGPGTATHTLPVQAYERAFTTFDMSGGSTVAVVSMLFVALVAVPYVRSLRHEEEAR